LSTLRPLVVIPLFDHAATIGDVVARALAQGLPVLVVDDGSVDGGAQTARDAGALVVAHAGNRGKGQALLTGWAEADRRGFSHALCLDADGQHYPEDIPLFLRAGESEPDAIVVGSRPMDGPHVPRSSRVGRKVSDFMLFAAAGHEIAGARPDTQCGYRLYPLRHVCRLGLIGRRYEFEMEVLVRAAWLGVPLRPIAIRVHYPAPGERVTHFRKWHDNLRIVGAYNRLMWMRLFWPIFRPRRRLL
jgi:glycosyltransferase involved in cell wall biosynthesis